MIKKYLSFIAIAIVVLFLNDLVLVAGLRTTTSSFGAATVHIYQEAFPAGAVGGADEHQIWNSSGNWTSGLSTTKYNVTAGSYESGILNDTDSSTTALTAAQICANNYISWNPSTVATGANATATLPTAVNLQANCLGTLGGYLDISIHNASTSGFIIISPGASTTLYYASTTATSTQLWNAETALIHLTSVSSTVGSSTPTMIEGNITIYK